MTKRPTTGQSMRDTYIARYMEQNPGITETEAYEMYKQNMRERGSKGGKNTTSRPFADIPGLAQRAARGRFKKNV